MSETNLILEAVAKQNWESLQESLRDVARLLFAYYTELQVIGFDAGQAFALTVAMQEHITALSRGSDR